MRDWWLISLLFSIPLMLGLWWEISDHKGFSLNNGFGGYNLTYQLGPFEYGISFPLSVIHY